MRKRATLFFAFPRPRPGGAFAPRGCYPTPVAAYEVVLLIGGGIVAGIVNTLAGGASVLSVPLLVLVGLPGTVANGTNRVGVLVHNAVASWRFRVEGVSGLRAAIPVLLPVTVGSLAGAYLASLVADATFERLFGVVMLLLVLPMIAPLGRTARLERRWSRAQTVVVFSLIGLFGGAFQAGVGLFLVAALAHAGYDLVEANSVKVVVNTVLTLAALVVFVARGQVEWIPGLVLSVGFAIGAVIGVRLAVRGGERLIRPALVAAVLMLAGRMLGFY
jgi:uncharacterized membrane protein YfcA